MNLMDLEDRSATEAFADDMRAEVNAKLAHVIDHPITEYSPELDVILSDACSAFLALEDAEEALKSGVLPF